MTIQPEDRDRQLKPQSPERRSLPVGQYVPDLDDDGLDSATPQASHEAEKGRGPYDEDRDPAPAPPRQRAGKAPLVIGGLVLAVVCGLALLRPNSALTEQASPAWSRHMQPLQARYEQSAAQEIKRVNRGGQESYSQELLVAAADHDAQTTRDVKAALAAQDIQKATGILQAAQKIPDLKQPGTTKDGQPIPIRKPELSEGLRAEILTGDTEFFHVYMFDCCAEDGDVVDLIINGSLFATVPITNQGATLSIPVSRGGSTTVNLRGVFDGGGGITVACRTSQGDFFMRPMGEGEVVSLAVVQ